MSCCFNDFTKLLIFLVVVLSLLKKEKNKVSGLFKSKVVLPLCVDSIEFVCRVVSFLSIKAN